VRVALVIERFRAAGGGVEQAAYRLVRELAHREIELTVVCRQADTAASAGASLVAVGGPRFWQPLRVLEFSRRAARAARGYDVVHSYSRTRRQHVYRAGGGSHASYLERMYLDPDRQRWSPRHRVLLAIEEAVFRDPRQIIECNSKAVADEIATRYAIPRERLVTIYNGVDPLQFTPEGREARGTPLRRALRLDGPVALFVGHGFERKGLDRAIDGLAASGCKADLLVVGRDDPGPWRERARQRGVESRVHFLGERGDVAALHAAADALVLPTRYDAFANACLEAMASGLPVATTPQNGAAELLEPGVSGWVLEGDFSEAFRALDDAARLARMGAAARERALAFSWEAHAQQVLELYERVAA
jgi:UDP-glucose:(heptosyl)LPS alpha-1,3-glucosyltransferase